jgi:hypothetical protein
MHGAEAPALAGHTDVEISDSVSCASAFVCLRIDVQHGSASGIRRLSCVYRVVNVKPSGASIAELMRYPFDSRVDAADCPWTARLIAYWSFKVALPVRRLKYVYQNCDLPREQYRPYTEPHERPSSANSRHLKSRVLARRIQE